MHHPPPPPLPADLFPSPIEDKTICLPTRSSPHQLKHASKLGFTPLASLAVNGTPSQKDSLQQSVYTDVPDDDLDLPPPPARRLPPPPPSKMKSPSAVSTLIPSPAPISTAGTKSPKLKGFSRLMLPAIPAAVTEQTHNHDLLPSTPPFTPPPPPPPPPLQTSGAYQTTVKNTATNGLPTSNALDAYSDKLPENLPVVKEIKNYKDLPQLPDKPSKKSTITSGPTFGAKKYAPKPPISNGISRNKTQIPSYNQKQTLPQGPETSTFVLPKPEFSSRTNHPNKSRPLPTIPPVLTGKTTEPSKANGGRGGGEVFDPREEDGDIYDVMDSTDM